MDQVVREDHLENQAQMDDQVGLASLDQVENVVQEGNLVLLENLDHQGLKVPEDHVVPLVPVVSEEPLEKLVLLEEMDLLVHVVQEVQQDQLVLVVHWDHLDLEDLEDHQVSKVGLDHREDLVQMDLEDELEPRA